MKQTFAQKLCWNVTKGIILFVLGVFFRIRYHGRENIPQGGALMAASNHVSALDPFIISRIALPRKSSWMAKSELFKSRAVRWYMKNMGVVEVHRGTSDVKAVKQALLMLKREGMFALFPEGTRSSTGDGSVAQFNPGVGLIAALSKAPILPVYIDAPRGVKPFRRVDVYIGELLDMNDLYMRSANAEVTIAITQRIQRAVEALRDGAVRS